MSWRGIPHSLDEITRSWDGEEHIVLFEPATGDTHLLSALAGLLLELLNGRTLPFDALLAGVQAGLAGEAPADLPELVHDHLHRLARLGLLQELPLEAG